jgi:thiamine monophosphate kinase
VISGYSLQGAARLSSTLEDAAAALSDLSAPAAEAGRIITSVAASTAPRRTGALAGSVAAEVVDGAAVVGSDLIYAPPIHNGWAAHRIRPQPFLEDAARTSEAQWVGAYEKAVDRALAGVEGA